MELFNISYVFQLPDGTSKRFSLEIDEEAMDIISPTPAEPPDWAKLNFHKCPHCQLADEAVQCCPLTKALVPVVREFGQILSFDSLKLEVVTKERVVSQETTAQRALSSFMGVIMACSGCPHTRFFKPMARFHLPLSSELETIYRATSMYLLAQYFRQQDSSEMTISLSGLETIYTNLQQVNTYLVKRLRSASKVDSHINAVIMLDMFARSVPLVIEESLDEMRYLFTSYLEPSPKR